MCIMVFDKLMHSCIFSNATSHNTWYLAYRKTLGSKRLLNLNPIKKRRGFKLKTYNKANSKRLRALEVDIKVNPEQQRLLRKQQNPAKKGRRTTKSKGPKEPETKASKGRNKKGGKPESEPEASDQDGPSDHGSQNGRPPADHPDRVFGCSRCRYAKLGCKTCKRPGFKPRQKRKRVESDAKNTDRKDEKDKKQGAIAEHSKKAPNKTQKPDKGKPGVSRKRTKESLPPELPKPAPKRAKKLSTSIAPEDVE